MEQAERLKSREKRTKVDRLDGQWAQWLIGLLDRIGLTVNRHDGQWARLSIDLLVDRLDG